MDHKPVHKNDRGTGILRRLALVLFLLISFSAPIFAQTELTKTLCAIYNMVYDLVPILAFVLFVLAGAAYAAGQFFGAEMRARAQSWSMSMLTGAIIGLLIVMLSGIIIKNLTGQDIAALCP